MQRWHGLILNGRFLLPWALWFSAVGVTQVCAKADKNQPCNTNSCLHVLCQWECSYAPSFSEEKKFCIAESTEAAGSRGPLKGTCFSVIMMNCDSLITFFQLCWKNKQFSSHSQRSCWVFLIFLSCKSTF